MAPTFKKSKDCPSAEGDPADDTPDADNRQLLISLGLAEDEEEDEGALPVQQQQQHKQPVGAPQAAGQQRASSSIAAYYPHAQASTRGGVLDALRARVEAAAAALQGQEQLDEDARDEVQGLLQDQQHQIDLLMRGQSSLRGSMNALRRGTKEQEASNEAMQQKHSTALRAMEGKLEQAIQQVQQLQQAARNRQQQQADSMQAALQAADQDRAQLAGKVAELQAALDRRDRQLQQAQQQQQQAQQQQQQAQQQQAQQQLEAQRLADQAAHDQQRSTTTALLADLAADCQAAQAEASSHAAALEAANTDLQRLSAQLSNATAAQTALERQLTAALQEAQQLQQQLQQAQEDRQGLTDRLTDRSAGLQQELVAAVQGRAQLQVQCDSAATSLLQAQVRVKQAEAKVAEMEATATALSSHRAELQNKGLQGEQATLLQRLDQLTADEAGRAAQLAEATQQLEQTKQQLTAGSQDRDSHAARLAALETENKQLVWRLAAQQAEHRKAQRAAAETMTALRQASERTAAQLAELQARADKRVLQATAAAAEEAEQCRRAWREEFEKRRTLQNEVITLKGNIRVLARIRPLLEKERTASSSSSSDGSPDAGLRALDDERVSLSGPAAGQTREWEFDRVFGPQQGQAAVYSEVASLVCSIMDGYSGCVLAYGQTGSGKTHTVEGPVDDPGINSRVLAQMFSIAAEREREVTYALSASVLEIYLESLFDLLAGNKNTGDRLDIKEGPSGLFIPGLRVEPVASPQDVVSVLQKGKQHRSTFATQLNEHSSRSHQVLTLYVTATQAATGASWSSKLHLIDLAGSERVSRSGAEGERLKEAAAINKSLSALGDVVSALQQRSSHVPYRNSKLTRLLEDSLGKEAKTLLVVNCSPAAENVAETKCSLEFALRARKVELGAAVRASVEQLTCSGSPGSLAATGRDSPSSPGRAAGGGLGSASASSSPRLSGRFTGSTGDLRQAMSSPSTTSSSRISRRSTPAAAPPPP